MRWLPALAALALLPLAAPAHGARTEIGVLTCSLGRSESPPGATEAPGGRQDREMLCAFRPRHSPEEIYSGSLQGFGDDALSAGRTMIWIVTRTQASEISAGLLQQAYAADPATPPGHTPPLVGESNASIVLQTMADKHQQTGGGTVIVLITLRLRSVTT